MKLYSSRQVVVVVVPITLGGEKEGLICNSKILLSHAFSFSFLFCLWLGTPSVGRVVGFGAARHVWTPTNGDESINFTRSKYLIPPNDGLGPPDREEAKPYIVSGVLLISALFVSTLLTFSTD